jgi:hypothetical protein
VSVDQKGGKPIARIRKKGSPNNMQPENGVYRRRYSHELDKENVVITCSGAVIKVFEIFIGKSQY